MIMSQLNIQDCCRICLNNDSEYIPILKDCSIQLHMKICLGITVTENDLKPKVLCVSCASQLKEFYNFQFNARCSEDWLESTIREKTKKHTPLQPLPDSEYNSDSLLEFLNNTENIEEYLNNLGKEGVPSIVSMFDKNDENTLDFTNRIKQLKNPSPIKKNKIEKMEIDVLDSDIEIVKELLIKETSKHSKPTICCACKTTFDSTERLTQHFAVCDNAYRYCWICKQLFESKTKLLRHKSTYHTNLPCVCNCGKEFTNKDKLIEHYRSCCTDFAASIGCEFSCKYCGDIFKDRRVLYKHAERHVLKAQLKMCGECGHNFIGEMALEMHKKKLHPVPANVLFRCKVCHKSSEDRIELYNHIQQMHVSALEPQKHLCESCGRSFATRASLMRHTITHKVQSLDVRKIVAKTVISNCEIIENRMCEFCGMILKNNEICTHQNV